MYMYTDTYYSGFSGPLVERVWWEGQDVVHDAVATVFAKFPNYSHTDHANGPNSVSDHVVDFIFSRTLSNYPCAGCFKFANGERQSLLKD